MGIHYLDCSILKFGDQYKIIYMKRYQADSYFSSDFEYISQSGSKLDNNICRAKSKVLALGMCNEWQYFVTFTLDKTKYDRFDLPVWQKDFSQYLRNQRRITGGDLKYLLIPERHKDGAWHMHGLMQGVSWDSLSAFVPGIHPDKLVRSGYRFHAGIHDRFGFNSFGRLKSRNAASKYALKYITKDVARLNDDLGAHLYYASKGLHLPVVVAQGVCVHPLTKIDYSNEFLSSAWISQADVDRVKGRIL